MHRKVLSYLRLRGFFVKCCNHTRRQIERIIRDNAVDEAVSEQKYQLEAKYYLNG